MKAKKVLIKVVLLLLGGIPGSLFVGFGYLFVALMLSPSTLAESMVYGAAKNPAVSLSLLYLLGVLTGYVMYKFETRPHVLEGPFD